MTLVKLLDLVCLMMSHWAAIFFTILIWNILSSRYGRGLARVPGPFFPTLSPLPRLWSVYRGFSHDDDIALHKAYGPLVRIAPNLISVSDPREINKIYGAGTDFIKGSFYSVVEAYDDEGLVPDPFVITNKVLHARLRRGAASAHSLNSLVRLEPYLDGVTERLVRKLKHENAVTGTPVDLAHLLQCYAMDAIFALTYGRDLNHMDRGDYLGFFKASAIINGYMAVIGQIPWMHRFLLGNPWIAPYFDSSEGNARIFRIAEEEMEADKERARSDQNFATRPITFIQRLLAHQRQDPDSINEREIITHCFNNVAAGSDTTAISLRSVIYNVLRDPSIHQRLAREVRKEFPRPDVTLITYAAASKLPYLSAVIREALRVHPSVGMPLVRVVPVSGATICGHFFQPGVEVGVSPWVIHRDPVVFDDPDTFKPERWLRENSSEEQVRDMNRSWIPFGHGAHTCSGRWISWMEVHKLTATLFSTFDMDLVNGGEAYAFRNMWLTPQTGLRVVLKERVTGE